jgi:hypothetical protein
MHAFALMGIMMFYLFTNFDVRITMGDAAYSRIGEQKNA